VAARAALTRAEGNSRIADDHLKRLEPLLPRQFVTEDSSGAGAYDAGSPRPWPSSRLAPPYARGGGCRGRPSQRSVALAAHDQSKSEQGRAQDAIGQDGEFNARIRAAERR